MLTITISDNQLADSRVRGALQAVLVTLGQQSAVSTTPIPPSLETFFSRARIVRKLCRKRVASCRLNRRQQFISNLTGEQAKLVSSEVYNLLPPRRCWSRPQLSYRRRTDKDQPSLTAEALAKQVLATLEDPSAHYAWKSRLEDFITAVQARALRWKPDDTYTVERVVPIPKDKAGSGEKYRIVAVYSLQDSMIASGFASYLSTLIDPYLIDSTLAFRPPRVAGRPPPSHHDAIDLIDDFRSKQDGEIWCAECDIQGFFDAICHDTVRRSLDHLLGCLPFSPDPRLIDFIESFLDGYSFADSAVPEARRRLAAKHISSPVFADPLKACRTSIVPPPVGSFGIPQGSAISCVLANVVLARADQACIRVARELYQEHDTRSLYVRYCDDIVILSTSFAGTERLLATYLENLKDLRLPYHRPSPSPYAGTTRTYGPKFWDGKSKTPYQWHPRVVPWLAFVGYHIHRDGRIRVRRKSIDKEIAKQNKAVSEVIRGLRRQIAASTKSTKPHELRHRIESIAHRMQLHLLSIGAGTPAGRTPRVAPTGVSWVRGFRALLGREVHEQWLRELDSNRTAALSRLSATLNSWFDSMMITAPTAPKRRPPKAPGSAPTTAEFIISHPGPNFSYARLLADDGRLINGLGP